MRPDEMYGSGDYIQKNPTWDIEDSPWKARLVLRAIAEADLTVSSFCEVGCGAGGVLDYLASEVPNASFTGFDIADGMEFWKNCKNKIEFHHGDFFEINDRHYDMILLLDVIEHLANPWDFLERIRKYSRNFLFHIPLDLSAQSVLRGYPLTTARKSVGHIHYFNKDLALELLKECGYKIDSWTFSGLSLNGPRSSLKSKLAYLPRRLAYSINKEFGVRLLGGESLVVLAH